ncbi:MAG: ABC transporter permease [Actinomycetota bacterium]|nr:ABC transporter permease [Actinomycetota bacterium]
MLDWQSAQEDGGEALTQRVSRDRLQVVSSKVSVWTRLLRIWTYRALLLSLVRKELSVKYKNSILGFAWSMLNPALTLIVYYVVFQLVLKNGIPQFAIFLLCGLVIWNFFSTALSGATTSVVANAGIVKKVSFPREVLPLASVGSSLVFFFLQVIVLVIALIIARDLPAFTYLPLIVPALVDLVLLAAAFSVFLSAVNVYFRDTQHLLEIVLMAWFWGTPVVYAYQTIAVPLAHRHIGWIYLLNPVTAVVLTFQRALYAKVSPVLATGSVMKILPGNSPVWYLAQLAIVFVVSCVLLVIALAIFGRMEGNFAEEL